MSSGKKFLLITYYWPPAGGAGVMRWAKMSKYIGDFGWQPVIYTHSNGEVGMHDESLLAEIPANVEVIKRPIWEPYTIYKTLLRRPKKEKIYSGFINEQKKGSFLQQTAIFIRGNFFIPDARKFWIKPSVRFLRKYLREHPVDAIVSTGPPHSMHLIAERLHKATGIPWVADFRDPWTNIDFYQDLHLTKWADQRHHQLELKVLRNASRVVTVTWRSEEEFHATSGRRDIVVIPNGFDHADYYSAGKLELDKEFTLVHVGSMNKDRNPEVLWKAIQEALKINPSMGQHFRLKLIGPVDFGVRAAVIAHGLDSVTEIQDYVPHDEAVLLQQTAQVVLLLINDAPNSRTMVPGKLYEYLGSRRPILAIGPPDSDSAKVIHKTDAGVVYDYNDLQGLTVRLLEWYDLFQKRKLKCESSGIEAFTRQNLAGQFAHVLDDVDK